MVEVCKGERVSSQHGAMGEIFSIPNNGMGVRSQRVMGRVKSYNTRKGQSPTGSGSSSSPTTQSTIIRLSRLDQVVVGCMERLVALQIHVQEIFRCCGNPSALWSPEALASSWCRNFRVMSLSTIRTSLDA